MADGRSPLSTADRASRGILIGGAIGAFGALLGFAPNFFWGIGLGMIAGLLAGITMSYRISKRNSLNTKIGNDEQK